MKNSPNPPVPKGELVSGAPVLSEAELIELVESVQDFGERAKLMAVNLAVVVAKLRQKDRRVARLNEDILDLVARITKASKDVADIVAVARGGGETVQHEPGGVLGIVRQSGIPDERVLLRLDRSLTEIVDLSHQILEWMTEAQKFSEGLGLAKEP